MNIKQTKVIKGFFDNLEALEKVIKNQEDDFVIYYRGQSREYELKPSLFRDKSFLQNEEKMVRDLLIRCPSEFSNYTSKFEIRSKMQHYSLPTRLLDITTNPLVALYFATDKAKIEKGEKFKDADGEVVVLKIPKKLIKYYDDNELDRFFSEPEQSVTELNGSIICVVPRLDNPRIIKQEGAYLLFINNEEEKYKSQLNEIVFARIKIERGESAKGSKKKIREQLELIGISQATLFPEIDSVALHIKQKYETPTETQTHVSKQSNS